MSPTIQMAPLAAPYTPTHDVMDRHDYGVTKNRKVASTGGGRAWSEDEEVYLLQTRLQKMPYKHIAAHLKKTELACRLHYHQLSHGSNRRKRTTSVSSGSSSGHSPILPATVPSPIHESPASRSASPPGSSGSSYGPTSPATGGGVQLPSIMASPRLPAILPKPLGMTLPMPTSSSPTRGYPTPMPDPPHSAVLPLSARSTSFPAPPRSATLPTTPPLRLDCSALPPPLPSTPGLHHHGHMHVDMARLNSAYSAHRASFWAAVAAEYGTGASAATLESAWRQGGCCPSSHGQPTAQTPITPAASPDNSEREQYVAGKDKTRIAAILGIDANPRSPRDREMVRRIEEERSVIPASA